MLPFRICIDILIVWDPKAPVFNQGQSVKEDAPKWFDSCGSQGDFLFLCPPRATLFIPFKQATSVNEDAAKEVGLLPFPIRVVVNLSHPSSTGAVCQGVCFQWNWLG